jgi:selenide, water dikinase
VLRRLPALHDPAVIVDASTSDDAAVYRLDAGRALVATADFVTPIVDDARAYGRIAAANALSDVYAMGARPLFALNLVSFPRDLLGEGILDAILQGGADAAGEAGIAIVGGHSIHDPEPKYGLCVIGEVHPERLVRNSGGRPGDRLVLTKAIGTGVISTAIRAGAAGDAAVTAAVASMGKLNRAAAEAMLRVGVHAATDVTGFGLLGHLRELARASGVAARVDAAAVPLLPDAEALALAGHLPGGSRRNREDLGDAVAWDAAVPEVLRSLLCDAQTSGGLLIAVAPERADALLDALTAAGAPEAVVVGTLVAGEAGSLAVTA